MPTPLDGDLEQIGDIALSSSIFDDGERIPDDAGYANKNRMPLLQFLDVPDDAESLVFVIDDPDAEPVVGHVFDHYLVWDIDPGLNRNIPRVWGPNSGAAATFGYNDYGEQAYGGPAPPEGEHTYRFKLLALDSELGLPPEARKAVIGHTIALEADILAQTQLTGTYHASQGTIF